MPRKKLEPYTPEEQVLALSMLQGVVHFPENLEVLAKQRLERERQEKFLVVQARLERNAKRKAWAENPRRVAAQVKRRERRVAWLAQQRAETETRKAEAKAKRQADLAANPTLAWRHPRRAGWSPSDEYARGSRRKNRSPDSSAQAGASASTSGPDGGPDDSSSGTAAPEAGSRPITLS